MLNSKCAVEHPQLKQRTGESTPRSTGIGFLQVHSATLIKIALKGFVAWFYFHRGLGVNWDC